MYFFTADEHYGHKNIIKHCNRPFNSLEGMDKTIVVNHNEVVGKNDTVIHAGDFAWKNAVYYRKQLNGLHIFLRGNHDERNNKFPYIREMTIDGQFIVICHYAMSIWNKSHYNAWQLFGHTHGRHEPVGKQWDIGVDNNDFYPLSFDQIKAIMKDRPDNIDKLDRG